MSDRDQLAEIFRTPKDPRFAWTKREFVGFDLREADLRSAELRQVRLLNCDLTGANLEGAGLAYSEFNNCKFDQAILRGSYLGCSSYVSCSFSGADLTQAYLAEGRFIGSDFSGANMESVTASWANFRSAVFDRANLEKAILQNCEMPNTSLRGARLANAQLLNTALTGVNLSGAVGVDQIRHLARSAIDSRAAELSGLLPVVFLRGCGLSDRDIEFYCSLAGAIHFNSCFISFAEPDRVFTDSLYADLQSRGIRCYYAPESMGTGERIRAAITEAIHIHDRVLVVLSSNSLVRPWVESEVEIALERERKEARTILFPIRLDDEIMVTQSAWGGEIRRSRNICDFRGWQNAERYASSLERLLQDLRGQAPQR